MSIERPDLKTAAPEREVTLQKAVDDLFEAEAPYHDMDEGAIEARHERARHAMDALLTAEVSRQRGEDYAVSLQGDQYFYLAQRHRRDRKADFDPMEELGVFAEAKQDLKTGRVIVDYDIKAMSRKRDGWYESYFDKVLVEDVVVELTASPEALKRTHEKLEAEYQQEVAEYEKQLAAFRELVGWVKKRPDKKVTSETWSEQPMLGVLWPWAEGADCEIGLYPSDDDREEVRLVIFEDDGKNVRDVSVKREPVKPERWFEIPV